MLLTRLLTGQRKPVRVMVGITLIFLTVELLDELVGGVMGAAWPLIRQDLHLSYVQVGLVMTIPSLLSCLVESLFGIWADLGQRRRLIVGGGLGFAIALALIACSQNFTGLLLGFVLLVPASGGFAELTQATWMDLDPDRHERNMARWTLAGSVGNVLGPFMLTGAIALNQGWRGAFALLAGLIGLMALRLWRFPMSFATAGDVAESSAAGSPTVASPEGQSTQSFRQGIRTAIAALKQTSVLRWLILLQISDLMLDGLHGFIALYFVDGVKTTPAQASLAIAVWLGVGLVGDFLLIPLLEHVKGLTYLKFSAGLILFLYPAFLLVPDLTSKIILLGCLGFLNAGWYSILKGQLYTAMPGQSGTAITLNTLFGAVGSFIPLTVGFAAMQMGLSNALWLLLLAPAILLAALWKH